jgi:hypothetical protein
MATRGNIAPSMIGLSTDLGREKGQCMIGGRKNTIFMISHKKGFQCMKG